MKTKFTILLTVLLLLAEIHSFGQTYLSYPIAAPDTMQIPFPNQIFCSAVYNGDLYVAGSFGAMGGVTAYNIAKWNGTNWSALGAGFNGAVRAMAVYNGELYIGGEFLGPPGPPQGSTYIAKWNGSTLSAVVGIMENSVAAKVSSMTVNSNGLFISGDFDVVGSTLFNVNNIARFDGSNWTALGTGILGGSALRVNSMITYNSDLYIGGDFTSAGGTSVNSIAKWNGSAWSAVGTGITGGSLPKVQSMALYNNELYVGGVFTTAGGVSANNIAKLNVSTWSSIGSGLNADCLSMTVHNGELVVGGPFTTAGGINASGIAKWNGTNWLKIGSGLNGVVTALSAYKSNIHAGWYLFANPKLIKSLTMFKMTATEPTVAPGNLNINGISTTSLTVNWVNGNGKKRLVVGKSGGAVNQIPKDTIAYTANASFGTGSDLGGGNYAVYGGTGNTVTVTNLTPDVIYHFSIFEYSDSTFSGYENYLTTFSVTANHTTIALEPTAATVSFSFSNVTLNDMVVTVSPGNGSHRIIIAKQASFVNNTPLVDTLGYAANSVFGTGPTLGTGNYIVYNGTGNTFNLTGLTPNLPYYFASYEYNGTTSPANNYLLATPATGMQGSLNSQPTAQPTNITFTNVTDNSMTLNWTNGDGINRIVIARTAAVNAAPTNGVNYNANSVFALGDDLGLNNYVVYSGSSNTFNLTGLTANTTYYFSIFEYNGTNTSNNYLIPGPATAFKSTLFSEPITPATNLTLSTITSGITTVSWTNGSGTNRVVVVREGAPLNELPDDGNGYIANSTFNLGDNLGFGNFICFNGNTNSFNLQGLNAANVYYVCVIEFNGSGTSANYLTTNFPIANNLPPQPTVAASSLNVSQSSNSSALVSWTNGNGQYRILLAKAGSSVDQAPVDGTVYTANASFTFGAQLGTGNFVVFNGTGNNVLVTNLDTNITYHFALYEFNKDLGGPPNYLVSPNLAGNINLVGLGINEFENKISFSASPNPFHTETTITFSEEQRHSTIKIMDVLGKEIKSIPFSGKQLILEKMGMQKGTYFIFIQNEEQQLMGVRKIEVQ